LFEFRPLFSALHFLLRRMYLVSGLVLTLFSVVVAASTEENAAHCDVSQSGCVAVGEWDIAIGVGGGLRGNPLIDGNDLPLFILPQIRYYGERFFFDTDTAGFTFYEDAGHFINGVATVGFEQLYFSTRSVGDLIIEPGPISRGGQQTLALDEYKLDENDFYAGIDAGEADGKGEAKTDINTLIDIDQLHKRGTAGLMGLEYGLFRGAWELNLQMLSDVTSVHHGQEVRAAVARFIPVAQELFELTGGFSWQSSDLLNYYYGIDSSEVSDSRLTYYPSDGVSPFLRLDWRRRISSAWSWQATVHQRWLSKEISESPLLDENRVLMVYLGGLYHF